MPRKSLPRISLIQNRRLLNWLFCWPFKCLKNKRNKQCNDQWDICLRIYISRAGCWQKMFNFQNQKTKMYDCIIGVTPESYEKGKQQA